MIYWWLNLVLSFILGIITTIVFNAKELDKGYETISLIEQCQKNLPRDQYCIIIAVPENEIEE